MFENFKTRLMGLVVVASLGTAASSQEVGITPDIHRATIETPVGEVTIERNQDTQARIDDFFALTSRKCPPRCIRPMVPSPGVTPVGEVEIIMFLGKHGTSGNGFLIDTRTEDRFRGGTIPGSTNIPFNAFSNLEKNPFSGALFGLLGGEQDTDGTWKFENAKELVLFCNGPWCGQSSNAIISLVEVGYPAEKLFYYRGGMQSWRSFGFNVVVHSSGSSTG